jgi:hypothetical protein
LKKSVTNGEAPMSLFRDFTVPVSRIFGGNLLMLIAIGFYIAWWTVTFRPNRTGKTTGTGFFIAPAILIGATAITIKFSGIETLSRAGKGFPVAYILLGAIALYIILLGVTRIVFQRPVTAELLLIVIWAALEGSAIAVLQGSNWFSLGQALTLATLMLLAAGVGIVCYILHYRLDDFLRFWNGLIPLIVDAGVVTLFLAVLALS